MSDFMSELTALLNRHSRENGSGTPDYILAEYLLGCLLQFNAAVNRREAWYGREQDQRFGTPVEATDDTAKVKSRLNLTFASESPPAAGTVEHQPERGR